MADNYLEKRMEDMKAGKLRPQLQSKTTAPRRGCLEFPFPPRRVLVVGGTQGLTLDIVRMFLKNGSKVAVIDTDKTSGESLAYMEGIRYYNLESPSSETIKTAFTNLLNAWRDVDIVIMTKFHTFISSVVNAWVSHRDRFPVPFGYAGRLILFDDSSATAVKDLPNSMNVIAEMLTPYRITVNAIIKSSSPINELRDPIRLIQTLVLPGNDFLSSLIIPYQ